MRSAMCRLPPAPRQARGAEALLHPQPLPFGSAVAALLSVYPQAALPSGAAWPRAAQALGPRGLRSCQPPGRAKLMLPVLTVRLQVLPQKAGLQVLRGPPAPAAVGWRPSSARQGIAPLELQAVCRRGTQWFLWDVQAPRCCSVRLALVQQPLPAAVGSLAAAAADTAAASHRRCVQLRLGL